MLFTNAERIFAIPAATVAGMQVKPRADRMREAWEFDGEISDRPMASIAADIERLAGAAS
jgi:hypothetical protein